MIHLRKLFDRFKEFAIIINPNKCVFGVPEVLFLGYKVNSESIKPPQERVSAIREMPIPKTVKELRRLLGMINFYRRFLPKAATTQAPLTAYLEKGKKNDKTTIQWNATSLNALNAIKEELSNAALLANPNPTAELSIMVDASDIAIGAVLQQKVEENWQRSNDTAPMIASCLQLILQLNVFGIQLKEDNFIL